MEHIGIGAFFTSKLFHFTRKMAAPYLSCWKSWSVLIADKVDSLLPESLRSLGLGVVREAVILDDEQLISMIPNYDVLIVSNTTRVNRPILEAGCCGGRLKIVANAGTGIDNIDCQAVEEFGVLLIHTPDCHTLSAAELTCGLLMAMSRNLPQACDSMRKFAGVKMFGVSKEVDEKDFQLHLQLSFRNQCEWNRNAFTGVELYGKTLGFIGLGRIGQAVAKRMASFGMKIIGYDPNVPIQIDVECVPLLEVFRRSDFITLHASFNNESRHIVNAQTLSLCKRGFCLVNCAHHGLVNETDLIEALDSGVCAAAAIDVYQEEPANMALIGHPRIICTPGLSICTIEAKRRVSLELLERLKTAIEQYWKAGQEMKPTASNSPVDDSMSMDIRTMKSES